MSTVFGPELWHDKLVEVWRINVGDFKQVKSPYLHEFPDAISPSDDFPIALTFIEDIQPQYSQGNKNITWHGVTIFHITPDLKKSWNPMLMLWPARILKAAAANVLLGGLVSNFTIMDQFDGIEGPQAVWHGDEAKHWGFAVNWMVQESLAGTALPVSAG